VSYWYRYVRQACYEAGLEDHAYAFVVCSEDVDTILALRTWAGERAVHLVDSGESSTTPNQRTWNPERYVHMVDVRNRLLTKVREVAPDMFLSLDSDILLHPLSLKGAVPLLEEYAAVALKTYLSPRGDDILNYGMRATGGGILRRPADGTFPVDYVMAAKLMTPAAYAVDYVPNLICGEDIGWSDAVRARGLRLGFYGEFTNKHLFTNDDLMDVDKRVGW
jgi:hypothetical protein